MTLVPPDPRPRTFGRWRVAATDQIFRAGTNVEVRLQGRKVLVASTAFTRVLAAPHATLGDDAGTLRIASDQQSAELLPLEGQPPEEVAREINDPTGLLEYVAAEPVPAASPRALSPEGSEAVTSRLTLARIVVAIGGLFCAFVLLAVLMVGTVMNTFAQGTTLWSFIPAFAIVLGYCVLVVRAVRGHRFAAGIVAAAAWLFALGAWQWIVNISGDPYASLWPAVVFAPVATLYALAATYVASRRGHASLGATRDPGPPPPAA